MNGSEVSHQRTLFEAYNLGHIPSISYGLHVGSVSFGINGSLVLGGYDRSRSITPSIVSTDQTLQLIDIGLGVAEGGSAFSNMSSQSVNGLLQKKSQSVESLTVMPNPGVPYLYLPESTCSAIASHLPVNYDDNLGLFLWNTSASSYSEIIGSPHYIQFTFGSTSSGDSATDNSTIYVPLAVLNLLLDSPVVSTKTQYFPCSPYIPSDGSTYHLGRAFLQSAYLSQNWQTQRLFVSQAPGPDLATIENGDIKTIASGDYNITPMINPPSWNETWSTRLKPLKRNSTDTPSMTNAPKHVSSSLTGGAIAGIVIGTLAGAATIAAFAFFFFRRRKRSIPAVRSIEPEVKAQPHNVGNKQSSLVRESPKYYVEPRELQDQQIYEAASPWDVPKVSERPVELDGSTPVREVDSRALH